MKPLKAIAQEMKLEEQKLRIEIPKDSPIIVLRSDGRAFSNLTRKLQKPFDSDFTAAMNAAAKEITRGLGQVAFNYVQSDEISTIITKGALGDSPFGGRVEKLTSIAASAASVAFNREMIKRGHTELNIGLFDSRALSFKNTNQLEEYLLWRRMDASKNAISMAAETILTHKQLHGMSTNDRREALRGTPFETIPNGTYWGRIITGEDLAVDATRENVEFELAKLKF